MKISRANKERHARPYAGHRPLLIWAIVEDVDGTGNSGLLKLRKFNCSSEPGIPNLLLQARSPIKRPDKGASLMPTPPPIEYTDASPQVRTVFDDIKKTRNIPDVNNFWKYLAHDPKTLKRTWESVKEVMAPGALEPLVKEMIYVAVSVTNGCAYCIATHTEAARRAGMRETI